MWKRKKKPNKNQFLLLCWDTETSKANSPLPWHCLESALEPGTQLLGSSEAEEDCELAGMRT